MRTLRTLASVLWLTACASPAAPTATPAGASAEPPPTHEASRSPTFVCDVGFGTCLGPLTAGTYTTSTFATPLTYTVGDGWANDEDLPGNWLLIPPGAELAGVNAGTSDFIGVYDGVAAASADCAERPQADVGTDPEAIAGWLADHDGIAPVTLESVTVGGLEGVVVDLRLADGYAEGCPYEGFEGVPMVPMLIGDGTGPADLHHVVLGNSTTRLYLLEGPTGRTVAIEVADLPGNVGLDELDAVAHTFTFGTNR
jgi:hypothetical protein